MYEYMNLLFYLERYPAYGGIESVTTVIANYMICQVDSISIYSILQQNVEELSQLLDKKIELYYAKHKVIQKSDINIEQLKNIINKKNIDTIVYQDSYAAIEDNVLEAIKGLGVRLIVVEHNTPDYALKLFANKKRQYMFKQKIWFYLHYIELYNRVKELSAQRHLKLLNNSDYYVLLSSKYCDIFNNLVKIDTKEKVLCINNPLTKAIPDYIDWNQKEKICLFCARFSAQKGLNHLMSIWKNVEKYVSDWRLVLVGDGEEREYVEKYIETYKLRNVILEGYRSDTEIYYRKASIICMTSIFEGWGLVLTEAMCYGCVPIVFDSYAAASDIINDGENGFLIPPFRRKRYEKKLISMMTNLDIRKKMATKAYLSCKKYAIDYIGEEWVKILANK